jgi:hypothetical protein
MEKCNVMKKVGIFLSCKSSRPLTNCCSLGAAASSTNKCIYSETIRQVPTSCIIRHISLVPWCQLLVLQTNVYTVKPVWSDTPRNQANVSDYTGCGNLSNLTHQGTRELCQIIQDSIIFFDCIWCVVWKLVLLWI